MADSEHILRSIWRDKIHVEPRALELTSPAVRQRFEHIWQPAELFLRELQSLPPGLLRIWEQSQRGHIVFTHLDSVYCAGPQPWRENTLESVCYLSVKDWAQDRMPAWLAFFRLLDHLLGSDAQESAPSFSDGGGLTPALREAAGRFVAIHQLGYGHRELGISVAGDYFAHTLWLGLNDPQRLNTLDPLVLQLYRQTLLHPEFWERHAAS